MASGEGDGLPLADFVAVIRSIRVDMIPSRKRQDGRLVISSERSVC
jgi:hypothetical protein